MEQANWIGGWNQQWVPYSFIWVMVQKRLETSALEYSASNAAITTTAGTSKYQ